MYNQNCISSNLYLLLSIIFRLVNFISISTFYTNIENIMRIFLLNEITFDIFHLFITLKVIFGKILVGLDYQ